MEVPQQHSHASGEHSHDDGEKRMISPADLLVDMLDDELVCSICYDIFTKPVIGNCGHSFCSRCIERWVKNHTNCPTCRKGVSMESFQPDMEKQEVIFNLPVSCSNCPWSGLFSELPSHLMDQCPAVASKVCVVRTGNFFDNVFREALRRFRQKKFVRIHCHTCRSSLKPGDYMFVHETRCKKHSSHLKMHLECINCAQSLFLQAVEEASAPSAKPQMFYALNEHSSGLAVPVKNLEAQAVVLSTVRKEKGVIYCNGCEESISLKSDCYTCLHESHTVTGVRKNLFYCQKCFVSAKHCTFHRIAVVSGSLKASHGLGWNEGPHFVKLNRDVRKERSKWFFSQGPLLSCNACGHCVDTEDFYRCLDCMKDNKANYNLCQNCYISYEYHLDHEFVKILDDLTRPSPLNQKLRAFTFRFSSSASRPSLYNHVNYSNNNNNQDSAKDSSTSSNHDYHEEAEATVAQLAPPTASSATISSSATTLQQHRVQPLPPPQQQQYQQQQQQQQQRVETPLVYKPTYINLATASRTRQQQPHVNNASSSSMIAQDELDQMLETDGGNVMDATPNNNRTSSTSTTSSSGESAANPMYGNFSQGTPTSAVTIPARLDKNRSRMDAAGSVSSTNSDHSLEPNLSTASNDSSHDLPLKDRMSRFFGEVHVNRLSLLFSHLSSTSTTPQPSTSASAAASSSSVQPTGSDTSSSHEGSIPRRNP